MKKRQLFQWIHMFPFIFILACGGSTNDDHKPETDLKQLNQQLEKANRYLVVAEEENINNFVNRYNWDMIKTGTGLRYMVYHEGNGPMIEAGGLVSLEYELRLLTGDLVYSSDKDGIMTFVVGRGGVPAGLEEGIKLLRLGDKAKFILPSHLAYGLLGDDQLIPSRAVLIYDIEVIDFQ